MKPMPIIDGFSRRVAIALIATSLLAGCERSPESAWNAPGNDPVVNARLQAAARATLATARIDPKAPMPALNAPVWQATAAKLPQVAARRARLEAAEQRALATLARRSNERLEARRPRGAAAGGLPSSIATHTQLAATAPRSRQIGDWMTAWLPQAHAQGLTANDFVGMIIGNNTVKLLGGIGDFGKVPPGTDLSGLNVDVRDGDGQTASMRVTAGADGRPTAELTSTSVIPMVLSANSKVALTTAGLCPDAAGKVEFTLRLSQSGHAGSGKNVVYDREIEVNVSATVGDDAEIAEADIRTRQGERSAAGGRQVYVETATEWHQRGPDSSKIQLRDHRLVRTSSQANDSDAAMAENGVRTALVTAAGALYGAAARWKSGTCIRIDAKSPGTVKPKASSRIPVRVLHRLEGGEIPARVTVTLSGGESITPELIAPAPGTLTHVAPDSRRAQMEIVLVATSRRGKAEERLKLSIADTGWRIDGRLDETTITGVVCGTLDQPFTATAPEVAGQWQFTPSDATGGKFSYVAANVGGTRGNGAGSYNVIGDPGTGNPVSLHIKGTGSIHSPLGTFSGPINERLTLTPIASCERTGDR